MEEKQLDNIINMSVGGRRHGRTYQKNRAMCEQLMDGQKVWIGTKNKAWFLTRFKEDTGQEATLVPLKEDSTLYNIKLKKDAVN